MKQKDKAKTKVEEALAKFEESDKSEDSFKNIVGNYSDDTATIENGGLYEHLGKDVYSDKVDEWVFSSERKAGDYSMIESDGDYNIVYIVSIDNPYWSYTVENAMKNNDWTKYLETLQEKYKDKITLDSNAANEII